MGEVVQGQRDERDADAADRDGSSGLAAKCLVGAAAAASGGQVCPHPETIEMSWPLRDRLMAKDPEGKGGLAIWNGSRPPFVEADAVQHAAYVAGVAGARMYIVHVSSQEALEAGLRQRRSGSRIALETCPHYLTHDVTWSAVAF